MQLLDSFALNNLMIILISAFSQNLHYLLLLLLFSKHV